MKTLCFSLALLLAASIVVPSAARGGDGAVRIQPGCIQIFAGVGLNFAY